MAQTSSTLTVLSGLLSALLAPVVPGQEPSSPKAEPPATQHQDPQPIAGPDEATMVARRKHWAWQPLSSPTPPNSGSRHAIDAFVAHRLAAKGLAPAGKAKANEQLRRLWFDLVGLPPTEAAIQRFGDNPSNADYLREVDTLLASPHYGERWARHWLDLMRYSETLGHEFDFEVPNAWRYRDYVIRALNDDVPYDQFVREHIAGDLLEQPRRDADGNNESVQATASWWFVEQTHSPVDAMQHQADRVDNQIDVFGKAFLGMTVACARCHDHKFDAIPTRDYYSLFGIVQSSRYVQASLKEVPPESEPYQLALASQEALAAVWSRTLGVACTTKTTLAQPGGVTFRPEDVIVADANNRDSRWYINNDAFGAAPWTGPFCVDADKDKPQLRELPGAFWHSGIAGTQREGTIATGTFDLTHRYVHVRVAGDHSRIKLIVDGFHIVRNPIYGSLHKNVDKQDAHWLTFDVNMWLGRKAHLMAIDQRAPDLGDPRHNRGRYPDHCWIAIQSVSNSPHPGHPETTPPPPPLEADAARTQRQWRAARKRLIAATDALPIAPTIPAMADGSGIDSHVYIRGNHRLSGGTAPRQFLSAIDAHATTKAPMPAHSSGRRELAEAVLADHNPLPARVLVNRLWHHLFGRGLVKSVDNFGALGDDPTHPQLLDWLARDFTANGWSLKHSIRRIVTSHAYRQSSRQRPEASALDGENRLVHRQNVRPLEAELVRDALLAISDRLDPKLFGRSIEQPREAITKARGEPGHHDPRDGRGRRSIYMAIRRNFMPEMLLAFDCPTPFATVGRRNTSNVPAQSLALANSALVHDLCQLFAKRCIAHSANSAQRLQLAYRLAFARLPHAAEVERLIEFVTPPAAGWQGDDELTTWTDAVHALVNTTEFRFRR